jgi:hypothetical protein
MIRQSSYAFEDAAPESVSTATARPAAAISPLVGVFSITIFLSAALLFMIEPMFARLVLPYLGGSPAVWNTCVVFFQAAMLAGYAYAHLLTRRAPVDIQVAIHVPVVIAAALVLPIALPYGWTPPVDRSPIPSLLWLLLTTVGGPFFVVSSTAPLLQRWFSQTRDRAASDPYFLYAASNLGSVIALLAYPFVVEPRWSLSQQRIGWAGAYVVFVSAIVICAIAAVRSRRHESDAPSRTAVQPIDMPRAEHITWRRQVRWLALAFVPSSLMLGVTTFLTTDVAAVPLLWIAPLTLYLLSFVIGFSSRPLIGQRAAATLTTITMMPVALTIVTGIELPAWLEMPLHLVAFFGFALLLHSRLAEDRPAPEALTMYYLWISIGGLLGGAFTTLAAPLLFTGVLEYPLMLLAVCAFRPAFGHEPAPPRSYRDLLIPAAMGVLLAVLLAAAKADIIGHIVLSVGFGIMGAFYLASTKTRLRFTAGVAAMLVAGLLHNPADGGVVHAERTFFGVVRVRAGEGPRHTLFHGNTMHGEQMLEASRRAEPLSYYHRLGPIGQVLLAHSDRLAGGRVGVVGLGAGSLAAYATPAQRWTFYEIDPAVARVAAAPQFFTYLDDCGSGCRVVLGDGRLSLARSSETFDLLVLDAFSSDAIPVHLLTREALQVYLSRLSPEGVLAFHISNRHLDLRPILGALAADAGLIAYAQLDAAGDRTIGHTGSSWMVMARDAHVLESLTRDPRWERPEVGADLWTDDFSNVVKALLES